jgi:hypothetical protein
MEREGGAFDSKTLSTGFPKLDKILGGGLLPDSNVLVVYDTYSMGWLLPFVVLRERVRMGDFGVIMNTVFPLSALNIELKPIGLDIINEGRNGNLAIIDIFASLYGVNYREDFVFVDRSFDAQTFVPKYTSIYSRILKEKIGERRPLGLDVTLDGLACILGEEKTVRLYQYFMALKEKARVEEKRKRPVNFFLLNRGRVSEKFISWISLYSQYVLEFHSEPGKSSETMFVRKSPLGDFEPLEGKHTFRIRKGKIEIE